MIDEVSACSLAGEHVEHLGDLVVAVQWRFESAWRERRLGDDEGVSGRVAVGFCRDGCAGEVDGADAFTGLEDGSAPDGSSSAG